MRVRAIGYLFYALLLVFSGFMILEWGGFLTMAYGDNEPMYAGKDTRMCTQAFLGHRFATRCENDEVVCYTTGLATHSNSPIWCYKKEK